MADKFLQIIYTNGQKLDCIDKPITDAYAKKPPKEFTKQELRDLLIPAVAINLYYAKQDASQWMWQRQDEIIPGELWRKCNKKYAASNFGRIYDIANKKIAEQYESNKKYGRDAEKIKQAINEDNNRRDIGYLKVNGNDVHRLVADAWLKKTDDIKGKNNIDIHHISNNGYDNSPYNLIYLPTDDHIGWSDSVHHKPKME